MRAGRAFTWRALVRFVRGGGCTSVLRRAAASHDSESLMAATELEPLSAHGKESLSRQNASPGMSTHGTGTG